MTSPAMEATQTLMERLDSHMGKADIGDLLRDCREAHNVIASLTALLGEAEKALDEARLQITHLHYHFGQTASGNAVLAQVAATLSLLREASK